MLLWLWCRMAATAPIWPLAWELPYVTGLALKWQQQQENLLRFSIITQDHDPPPTFLLPFPSGFWVRTVICYSLYLGESITNDKWSLSCFPSFICKQLWSGHKNGLLYILKSAWEWPYQAMWLMKWQVATIHGTLIIQHILKECLLCQAPG